MARQKAGPPVPSTAAPRPAALVPAARAVLKLLLDLMQIVAILITARDIGGLLARFDDTRAGFITTRRPCSARAGSP